MLKISILAENLLFIVKHQLYLQKYFETFYKNLNFIFGFEKLVFSQKEYFKRIRLAILRRKTCLIAQKG